MDVDVSIELFPRTADVTEIRIRQTGSSGADSRFLDSEAVQAILGQVDETYRPGSGAVLFRDSSDAIDLGKKLYHLLDGDESWLDRHFGSRFRGTLRIDPGERFRHLPWELLNRDGQPLLVNPASPFTLLRAASSDVAGAAELGPVPNRPLRVLFMAASAEGVEPVLAFEDEEARILDQANDAGIELIVEERGSLAGLADTISSYGPEYFDIVHLSGHATVSRGQPWFILEDDVGQSQEASALDIAASLQNHWPRVLFVSGCQTGQAVDGGATASMGEALVDAGAPLVLAWSLPVGDRAASQLAAELYGQLANGANPIDALWKARHELYEGRSPFWHYLRVYTDNTALTALVTPRFTPERVPISALPASQHFLDPVDQKVKVVDRQGYVGRRRLLQRCLHYLRAPLHDGGGEGLVLTGMGGLGKSTTASRLLERMATHQRLVHVGGIDETGLRQLINKTQFPTTDQRQMANKILNADLPLDQQLVQLLGASGPFATVPCLFVFDDFENNLDELPDGSYRIKADAGKVLSGLLRAIGATNSSSRVIVTSRFEFPAPHDTRLEFEAVETLSKADQQKMLRSLANLDVEFGRARGMSDDNIDLRERTITAAAGNPRLLEWLNDVIVAVDIDAEEALSKVEAEVERFRVDVLARHLLSVLTDHERRMLAQVNLIELPIPRATIEAMVATGSDDGTGEGDGAHVDSAIKRTSTLGLLEVGTDPVTDEPRYFASNVLRELLNGVLTDTETTESCAAAARSLYGLWIEQ